MSRILKQSKEADRKVIKNKIMKTLLGGSTKTKAHKEDLLQFDVSMRMLYVKELSASKRGRVCRRF